MTSPLPEIADALYGRYGWTPTRFAHVFDVNPRRVRAWLTGEEPVPEGVWRELYEMLQRQARENARLSGAVLAAMIHPREEGR